MIMADNGSTEYMLTTVDNPFNPFTDFDAWLQYDTTMGYNTASFLDRVANASYDLSDADLALAIQNAIDEIVEENVLGVWRKVSRTSVVQFEPEQM
jgi:hypothetical protein